MIRAAHGLEILAQAQPAPHWHCAPQLHVAPQGHWGPQAQAVGAAACWQPQVQAAPEQDVHEQAFEIVVLFDMTSSLESG